MLTYNSIESPTLKIEALTPKNLPKRYKRETHTVLIASDTPCFRRIKTSSESGQCGEIDALQEHDSWRAPRTYYCWALDIQLRTLTVIHQCGVAMTHFLCREASAADSHNFIGTWSVTSEVHVPCLEHLQQGLL